MTDYIYTLLCPETKAVRYVGKASNLKARLRQHRYEAKSARINSHKCTWLRSLFRKGVEPIMEVDCIVPDGECWKQTEVRRVAYYLSIGCDLTNGTKGGDEPGELTEEGRQRLAANASNLFGSAEGRVRQSQLMKDLCADKDWLKSRNDAAKRTRATPEYKARMSARARAKWADPGYREKMKVARADVCASPAYRKRLSESVAAAQSSPEVRAAIAEKTRLSWIKRKMDKQHSCEVPL